MDLPALWSAVGCSLARAGLCRAVSGGWGEGGVSGGWQGSTRRARLPKDWPARVAATKARAAGRCEGITIHGEPRWHVDECDGIGRECDHDKRGDDHGLSNLRWLSTPCHKRKTQAEKPSRKRPAPPHPGRLT